VVQIFVLSLFEMEPNTAC